MDLGKTVKVSFLRVETNDENYIARVTDSLDTSLKAEKNYDTFHSTVHHLWKVMDKVVLDDKEFYFIILAKERKIAPIWFNETGEIRPINRDNGLLGDLHYCIFSPRYKFVALLSGTSGSPVGSFKQFFNEFSSDLSIRLVPFFENDIEASVLAWNYYKKLSTRLVFPTYEDLETFIASDEGKKIELMSSLSGLRLEVNVSAPKGKQMLSEYEVKDFISTMIDNEFCEKLLVRGGDFGTKEIEEVDIKNAVVSYSERVVVEDGYLEQDEARGVIFNAINDKSIILFE